MEFTKKAEVNDYFKNTYIEQLFSSEVQQMATNVHKVHNFVLMCIYRLRYLK